MSLNKAPRPKAPDCSCCRTIMNIDWRFISTIWMQKRKIFNGKTVSVSFKHSFLSAPTTTTWKWFFKYRHNWMRLKFFYSAVIYHFELISPSIKWNWERAIFIIQNVCGDLTKCFFWMSSHRDMNPKLGSN
jgi:hypothetical protein